MDSDECHTPPEFFALCNRRWGPFTIDLAATCENRLCPRYCGSCDHTEPYLRCQPENRDGLAHNWSSESAFVNPPYSRGSVIKWVRKAPEAERCVMLLKADLTTRWARLVWDTASEIVFLQSRIAFDGPGALVRGQKQGAAFPSMLAIWRRGRERPSAPTVSVWNWRANL